MSTFYHSPAGRRTWQAVFRSLNRPQQQTALEAIREQVEVLKGNNLTDKLYYYKVHKQQDNLLTFAYIWRIGEDETTAPPVKSFHSDFPNNQAEIKVSIQADEWIREQEALNPADLVYKCLRLVSLASQLAIYALGNKKVECMALMNQVDGAVQSIAESLFREVGQ